MKNPQHDFPKMRGGGGSKAVWNFSENSSVLEWGCFPKLDNNSVKTPPGLNRKIFKNCHFMELLFENVNLI